MLAVGVRLLLSACEVPSISMVPEITGDYVERTTLFRYRYLSGWLGGLAMLLNNTDTISRLSGWASRCRVGVVRAQL